MKKTFLFLTAAALFPVFAEPSAAAQKVIKDPAEYTAYMASLNTAEPSAKAAAMVAFVKQYPASVVKVDALEQAMAAYQQAGNQAQVEEMSAAILKEEPANVRALAISAYLERVKATSGDKASLKRLGVHADLGLKSVDGWQKPEGLSDEDFARLKLQMRAIFEGASGFVALQSKSYLQARSHLRKSFELDPSNLQDCYQLSIAELEMKPLDPLGFWHAARAMQLTGANAAGRGPIEAYAKARYKRYHGGDGGWDELVKEAAGATAPPEGFSKSVKKAPTPAEMAVQAVKENDPSTLSIGDWEFILSQRDVSVANKAAAKKVWDAIRAKQKGGTIKLKIPMKVVSWEPGKFTGAISDENRSSNTGDVQAILKDPKTAAPAPGEEVQAQGLLTGYSPEPFHFVMKDVEISKQPDAKQ